VAREQDASRRELGFEDGVNVRRIPEMNMNDVGVFSPGRQPTASANINARR
jgi:hypothetical protein